MYIGGGQSGWFFFAADGTYGARVVWPLPLLTPAKFISNMSLETKLVPEISSSLGIAEYLFREDAFDPVTRIRRERCSKRSQGAQPANWTLRKPPPLETNSLKQNGSAFSFESVVAR